MRKLAYWGEKTEWWKSWLKVNVEVDSWKWYIVEIHTLSKNNTQLVEKVMSGTKSEK